MTVDTRPEAVALMGLAKAQAGSIDLLLQDSSLMKDAGYLKEMQAASHSVVDCLLEGLNKARPEQFQKNFLVIAKGFNAELRNLLIGCYKENHLNKKQYEKLLQANTVLEAKILSFIRQLQGLESETTTITTENKS